MELGSSRLESRNRIAGSWMGGTVFALITGDSVHDAEYTVFAQQMNGWSYLLSEPKATGWSSPLLSQFPFAAAKNHSKLNDLKQQEMIILSSGGPRV